MKITKRQLRKMVREACGLETGPAPELPAMIPDEAPLDADPNVPVPEDYEVTRDMLEQNPELTDLGLSMVMDMAGTGCERSTAQGVIDHLQDMLDGPAPEEDDFSFTGDVGELPGDEAFGIGYEAGRRGL